MTGPDHYQAAERLLGEPSSKYTADNLAAAQVHATLALAAATALGQRQNPRAADENRWEEAAGAWPDSTK